MILSFGSSFSSYLLQSLDTANGLSHLHEKGICHGGLKGVRVAVPITFFLMAEGLLYSGKRLNICRRRPADC